MATISKACSRDPQIGHRHENGKWRVVIGWSHKNDTIEGLKEGAIWCWVSERPEKLQVFDQEFNRSLDAGEKRDCGVANFTMIDMFHPYWTCSGIVPKDGVSKDKKFCRIQYNQLIRKHRLALGLPVDVDLQEHLNRIAREKKELREQRKAKMMKRRELAQALKESEMRMQNNLDVAGRMAENVSLEESTCDNPNVAD